jgi:TolA-binding protein
LIRGVLATSRGDTAAGIEEIKLAYDFDPRDEEAAYQLGMAYLRAGNCRAALPMFKRVGELKGTVLLDNVPLLLPVSMYRIGECYDRLGDPAAAKAYYTELAKTWAAADNDLLHGHQAVHE